MLLARRIAVLALALALALSLAAPAALHAQQGDVIAADRGDGRVAALAARLTPVGAMAPSVAGWQLGRGSRWPLLHIHAAVSEDGDGFDRRTLAGSLELPVGAATLALTGGLVDATCPPSDDQVLRKCAGTRMLGAGLTLPLLRRTFGREGAARLTVGTTLGAGVGNGSVYDATSRVAVVEGTRTRIATHASTTSIQLPVALALRAGRVTLVPSLQPGLVRGHARVHFQQSDSDEMVSNEGSCSTLDGGLGIRFHGGSTGLDVGFHHAYAYHAPTLVGVAVVFGR